MSQTIECIQDNKFNREFKKMSKICRTLTDDFIMFEKALLTNVENHEGSNKRIFSN